MTQKTNALPYSGAVTTGADEIRIIRPITPREGWPARAPIGTDVKHYIVLDTETEGFDCLRHEVIEICAARIAVDETGAITAVEAVRTGLNDPGRPLTQAVREVTGIADVELEGQSIDPNDLAAFLATGEGIIAFNAGFDRPFVDFLIPPQTSLNWGCAMKEIPWRRLGFEPGSQGYLLAQAGFYNPRPHRARDDVMSLIQLLNYRFGDGETAIGKIIESMSADAYRFEATTAPFFQRNRLKDQGYKWSSKHKIWHKLVHYKQFREEYRWYRKTIERRPSIAPLAAHERYRGDHNWTPIPPKKINLEEAKSDPF